MKRALHTALVLGHYLAARRRFTGFGDRAALESWQAARVRRHLRWVARHSPFYRAWFEEKGPGAAAEFSAWPQTDKRFVTRHLAAWLTRPVDLGAARRMTQRAAETRDFTTSLPGNVTVGLSSGTTGPASMFFVSARERRAWAGLALARILHAGSLRQPQRIAFFLRANSPLYETVGSPGVRFTYFDLQQPVAAMLARLERIDPTMIVAPPSVLRRLAAARADGRLRIVPWQVVSVAEVFDPDDRAAVENAFGHRADEVYQASEGFLAATCPAGALHWNEDVIKLEREGLGGGRYHPIITDFRRRLQPVIRYRLGDVVTDEPEDAAPCACGSVFRRVRRIEGRQDDSVRLRGMDGADGGVLFPDFVRLAVSAAADGAMEDFRVRQSDPDTLEVSLWPEPPLPEQRADFLRRLEHALTADCARAGGRVPVCRWTPWTDMAVDDDRKRRRVVGLAREGES